MSAEFVPERNDDELRILSSVLDVVRNDRYVPKIQCGVDLIHEVQRGGLGVESTTSVWENASRGSDSPHLVGVKSKY